MARKYAYLPHFVNSGTSPDKIFRALVDCVLAGSAREACLLFQLAETYWSFDCLRVADAKAHEALKRIKKATLFAATAEQRASFEAELAGAAADPGFQREACDLLVALGPPAYEPRYMLDFVAAVEGANPARRPPRRRLVEGFDAVAAWHSVLRERFGSLPRNPSRNPPRRKVERLLHFVHPEVFLDRDGISRRVGLAVLERRSAGYDNLNVERLLAERGEDYFGRLRQHLTRATKTNEDHRENLIGAYAGRFTEARIDRLLEFHESELGARWRKLREDLGRLNGRLFAQLRELEEKAQGLVLKHFETRCKTCKPKAQLPIRDGKAFVDVTMSPNVLYQVLEKCVAKGDWEAGVFVFLFAEAFWRFDCLRVADPVVLGALVTLQQNFLGKLSEEERGMFFTFLGRMCRNPQITMQVRDWLAKFSPPAYEPLYLLGEKQGGSGGPFVPCVETFRADWGWARARIDTVSNVIAIYQSGTAEQLAGPWGAGAFGIGHSLEFRALQPHALLDRMSVLLQAGNIRLAALHYFLAEAFWRYDGMRVFEPAHPGGFEELSEGVLSKFPPELLPPDASRFRATLAAGLRSKEVRDWVAGIGKPTYEPFYRICAERYRPDGTLLPGSYERFRGLEETWRLALFGTFGTDAAGPAAFTAADGMSAEPWPRRQRAEGEVDYAPYYLNNRTDPSRLYVAIAECVQCRQIREAGVLHFLAEAYGSFDRLRVKDPGAFKVQRRIRKVAMASLDPGLRAYFRRELAAAPTVPEFLQEAFDKIRRIGPPAYEPSYLGADISLKEGFDPAEAWRQVLEEQFGELEIPEREPMEPAERVMRLLHPGSFFGDRELARMVGTRALRKKFDGEAPEEFHHLLENEAEPFFEELEGLMKEAARENRRAREKATRMYEERFGPLGIARLLEFHDTELGASWHRLLDECVPLGAAANNDQDMAAGYANEFVHQVFPELLSEVPARGVVTFDQATVSTKMSPNLLYDLIERSMAVGNLGAAVIASLLAEAYWRYDCLRVSGAEAGGALEKLREELQRKLPAAQRKRLAGALSLKTANPRQLREAQAWVARYAPPTYEPVYLLTAEQLAAWDPAKNLSSLIPYEGGSDVHSNWNLATFATLPLRAGWVRGDWRAALVKARASKAPAPQAEGAKPAPESPAKVEIHVNRTMHPHALYLMIDRCLAADNIRFAAFIHFLAEAYWRFDKQRLPDVAAKFAFDKHREEILGRHSPAKLEQLATLVSLAPANAAFVKEARDWVTHALGLPTYKYLDDQGQPIPEPNLNFGKCWELALFATFATAGLPQDSQRLVYFPKRKPKAA